MISIGKFRSSETDQSRMQALRLLVLGIGLHSVEGTTEDRCRFRESMQQISEGLADDLPADQLLARAGSILEALDEHNRLAVAQMRLQADELRNMVEALTTTISTNSAANPAHISRLHELREQAAKISSVRDVETMRAELNGCLNEIQHEVERKRKETAETIEQLNRSLEEALERSRANGTAEDTVTGLPMRPEAELALAQAGRSTERIYAAIVVLDRLQTMNMRFGREVGESLLTEVVQIMRQQLSPGDQLFRWSGTALLALMARPDGIESVRSELARMMETKLEHVVRTASRTILLPIGARWSVFPMMAAPRMIYQKLDTFASFPAVRD